MSRSRRRKRRAPCRTPPSVSPPVCPSLRLSVRPSVRQLMEIEPSADRALLAGRSRREAHLPERHISGVGGPGAVSADR